MEGAKKMLTVPDAKDLVKADLVLRRGTCEVIETAQGARLQVTVHYSSCQAYSKAWQARLIDRLPLGSTVKPRSAGRAETDLIVSIPVLPQKGAVREPSDDEGEGGTTDLRGFDALLD